MRSPGQLREIWPGEPPERGSTTSHYSCYVTTRGEVHRAVVLLMVVVASYVLKTAIDITGIGRGAKKFL